MKCSTLILIPILIALCCLDSTAQVIDKVRFVSKGDPKAKGLSYSIDYPSTWTSLPTDRPNVTCKLISEDGKGTESLVIVIKKLPALPSSSELAYLRDATSKPEFVKQMEGNNKYISGNSKTVIDGLPGSTMEYYTLGRAINYEIPIRNLTYNVFYKDFLIIITFAVAGQNQTQTEKTFQTLKDQFERMAISFVLSTRYQ